MIITKKHNEYNAVFQFPDQFIPKDKKNSEAWISDNLDYFANIAWYQWQKNANIRKNYRLKAGIFDFADYDGSNNDLVRNSPLKEVFDEYEESTDFTHLKHYPIINTPINTMLGELSSRVFKPRVKAIDEDSASVVEEYRTQEIAKAIMESLSQDGRPDEEIQQELNNKLKRFNTIAEEWANKFLQVAIHQFDVKGKSRESMEDYLTCDREFHHIYEDQSKLGFNYIIENPSNIWYLAHPNATTTAGCYAIGTIERLHVSDILNRFVLTEEETKHLLSKSLQVTSSSDGLTQYTISSPSHPDLYSPPYDEITLVDRDLLDQQGYFAYDTKQNFKVVRAYWSSKEKIGKVVYLDAEGYQNTRIVTEDYEFSPEEGDISIEWTYKNVWYKGTKIDTDIYIDVEPIKFSKGCPIIGRIKSNKNATNKSMVDLMKPYQIDFNIAANKINELLGKDNGQVLILDAKLIPNKDSEDPLEQMLYTAREKGMVVIDSSTENTGGPIQFNQITTVDWSRSKELAARLEIMHALKEICLEFVGITPQRTGSTVASESATGVNTALNQSYAQTEPRFKAHEEIIREVLQRIIDVGQYVAISKPESTINYLTTDLENLFFKVKREDLFAELFAFVTDLSEDRAIQDTLKQLAQAAMQNGADLVDVADMLTTNADKKIRDVLEKIKQDKQKMIEHQQQMEEQQLQLQQQQLQIAEQHYQQEREDANKNAQLDRENKLEVAAIQATGYDKQPDGDNSGDILNLLGNSLDRSRLEFEKQVKRKELEQRDKELRLKEKEIEVKKIAAKNKPKTPPKKR